MAATTATIATDKDIPLWRTETPLAVATSGFPRRPMVMPAVSQQPCRRADLVRWPGATEPRAAAMGSPALPARSSAQLPTDRLRRSAPRGVPAPGSRSRQIAGAEREGGGACQHFRARRLIERSRPCQIALRLAYVGKRCEAVLIGLECGRPRLLRGGEQRRGCLMLAQGDLRVVVRLPDLAHGLVLRVLQLVFRFALQRLGEAHLVATLKAVEQQPFEPEAGVVLQLVNALIRAVVDLQLSDVAGDRRPRRQARPVVRARMAQLGLFGAHAREPRDEVRALPE